MNWKEVNVEVDKESFEAVANIMNELGSTGLFLMNLRTGLN